MSLTLENIIEPLIERKIFKSEEEALRNLVGEYLLKQITGLKQEIEQLEKKYHMDFNQFSDYLHERSLLIEKADISPEKREILGKAIMVEEDDWLEWKSKKELLDSWLGLK